MFVLKKGQIKITTLRRFCLSAILILFMAFFKVVIMFKSAILILFMAFFKVVIMFNF
jgi:hypothetical protein